MPPLDDRVPTDSPRTPDTSPIVTKPMRSKHLLRKAPVPVLFGIDLCIRAGDFAAIRASRKWEINAAQHPRCTRGPNRRHGADQWGRYRHARDDALQLASEDMALFFSSITCSMIYLLGNVLYAIHPRWRLSAAERTASIHLGARRSGARWRIIPSQERRREHRCAIVRALANAPRIVLATNDW